MDVLRAVAEAPQDSSPSRIAERVNLPRPTVYRLLGTLESIGLVEKTDDGGWAVGYELIRLGRSADRSLALVARAQPTLEALMQQTRETAMLAIGRGAFDVDVISHVDAPNLLGTAQWVGRSVAPHASAAGKLLLAALPAEERVRHISQMSFERFTGATITDAHAFAHELDAVARHGYATTVDEIEQGLSGIAAPTLRPDGSIDAIVGIYGPTARVIDAAGPANTDAVLSAARRLAADL
jgi:DNA-binding IclR family transcriptional regulator